LIDIATQLERDQLEAAINEADKRDLVDPDELRAALDQTRHRPGVRALRQTLDRRTFRLTDSELERRFLQLTCEAGLPLPATGQDVNGFKVDFYWADLGLVVETDGLRYHRTPTQQARDRVRDQTHTAAGLTTLRFTHSQVVHQPGRVVATLAAVARPRFARSDRSRTATASRP
jgi:very-short-patch-repair endonuclease